MPKLTYNDMTVSVSVFSGNTNIKLRTLNKIFTPQELAELLYPIFDAQEKAEANVPPRS